MSQSRHVVCPHCEAVNRVPETRLQHQPRCGKCREPLFTGAPVELDDRNFSRHLNRSDLPLVVDFWASWCAPCLRSFPWMSAMQEKYADQGLVVLAINLDKEREDMEAFLSEHPPAFRIVHDPDAGLAQAYHVQGMPSSYVLGRDGKVFQAHAGFRPARTEEYEASIRQALGLQP